MTPNMEIDKTTNVAFLDVEEAAADAVIRVQSVSEILGLKSEVLVRLDVKNRRVLGLMIQDFKAFKREIRVKYLAWRVEKLIELLLCTVKSTFSFERSTDDSHLLAPAR